MANVFDVLSAQDIGKFGNLQVLAKQVVEGFCSGLHRSPHKGFSVEFKEHRSYVTGDDIRTIDWKLFGKTDRLYIREYEEETNLRCTILLDSSGSMGYTGGRSNGVSKHEYAVRTAASLAYLMLHQQDSVGLVTFDKKVRKYIPPRGRPKHLKAIVAELQNQKPKHETDLGSVFHQMVSKIQRRGMVIVVSDLFGDVDSLMKSLAHFRHARHEVLLFQIWDPDELDFPFRQWTQFTSLEASENRHLVDPAQLRKAYLEKLAQFREQLSNGCNRQRIRLVPLVTDQPYADSLAAYFAWRKKSK
ncbi:hypothetical protein FF011L_28900 [Roseimaritima multifibrata]|uniref:VWFA domain-containing protein n=1 Tax=Roseimaritima multifibrata TaxID=1930274 RepID=A0A517MGU7_9BACT|nr:DUF58 domain-containing protein [Roseimaritima multifibrata]QDS94112.1 hypothetical protein FF011L_28900 [Roseimaritima multifibrata]